MAATTAFLAVAVAAALLQCAIGATVTVGAPGGGWDQTTDLQTWAATQALAVGDTLVFQYAPNHNVLEVSKPDYDACRASSPIKSYTGGSATAQLPAPGKRYFICGTAGHCSQGMKLVVDVSAAAASPTPATEAPKASAEPTPATEAPKASAEAPSSTETSGSPPSGSSTTSPSPAGSSPGAAPSGATGVKASVAAVIASGLLMLLLAF